MLEIWFSLKSMYIKFLSVEKSPGPSALILLLDRSSLSSDVNGTKELQGTLTRELLGNPEKKNTLPQGLAMFIVNVFTESLQRSRNSKQS